MSKIEQAPLNDTIRCINKFCDVVIHPAVFSPSNRDRRILLKSTEQGHVSFPIERKLAIACLSCGQAQVVEYYSSIQEYLEKAESIITFYLDIDGWHKEYLASVDKEKFIKTIIDQK